MKVESIEIILVFLILSVQVYVFTKTYFQIIRFRNIIPNADYFKISPVFIPVEDLEKLSPKEILESIFSLEGKSVYARQQKLPSDPVNNPGLQSIVRDPISSKDSRKIEINIIEILVKDNRVLTIIINSINSYLIRNAGASTDFNLIKDIVERNINAVEEDINITIGIPLYLGLMGTMMGIVIGLFNMPDLGAVLDTKAKDIMLNDGIGSLIGGVKIAMIASFSGLMLTIINTGWVFKGSRNLSEYRKNELYTFIQIRLLPIINQGLASTLESLQRNLIRFNDDFSNQLSGLSKTVGRMEGIFDKSNEALEKQKYILEMIDKTKVSEMTQYNVKVLRQLDISVEQFEKFNSYLSNVNLFVENSQLIVGRTNELLARTDNFKVLADQIDNKLNQSEQLLNFLSVHFEKLEEHKEFTSNAVADVGSSISDTFKELKVHIQQSSESMKNFTVDELELLKRALSESKTNLSNLEHLSTLKTDVSQFKNSASSQLEKLKTSLESSVSEIRNISSDLKLLRKNVEERGMIASVKKIQKWFNAK